MGALKGIIGRRSPIQALVYEPNEDGKRKNFTYKNIQHLTSVQTDLSGGRRAVGCHADHRPQNICFNLQSPLNPHTTVGVF